MPVGLVVFEILSSVRLQSKNSGYLLRKHLKILSRIRVRPKLGTILLTVVTVYLVCSRLGPVLTRVGESANETFELEKTLRHGLELEREGLQLIREACRRFRDATRVPGPLARRYEKIWKWEREREASISISKRGSHFEWCKGQSSCFPFKIALATGAATTQLVLQGFITLVVVVHLIMVVVFTITC